MRIPMKKIAGAISALLVFQLFGALPQASYASVDTCAAANFSVVAKHNPVFYFDKPNFYGNYVQFRITNNNGSSATGYYAKLESFTASTELRIADYESASHPFLTGIGASKNELTAGASVDLYWYLKALNTDANQTDFDVVIYNGEPGGVGTEVCRVTSSITKADSTISANANKLTSVIYSTLPTASANGSETFTATVKGQTGTIGAGPTGAKDVNLSPVTNKLFDATRYRLSGTSFRCGTSTPVLNQLYIPNACSGNYVAVFTYQYLSATPTGGSAINVLSPILQIASGSQMKHTASPSFTIATIGSAPTNQVTTNAATYVYSSSATLNGTIDYGTYSSLYFCYSSTNPNTHFADNCNNKLTAVNDGNGNITANLSGLTNNTVYYFELTGQNSTTYTKGGVLNFRALGVARTDTATAVTSDSATVNGYQSGVLAADVDTATTLFYYTTSNPGSGHLNFATSETATVTASASNSRFSARLTGLTGATTYYYELVLVDINSQSYVGGVRTFATTGVYTVTFDSNTATSGSPGSATVTQSAEGASVTLTSVNDLVKTGYDFKGWNTNRSGTGSNYDSGTAYTPTQNITLYAKWVGAAGTPLTMTFDPNSGSFSSGRTVETGTVTAGQDGLSVKPASPPTRDGFTFKGWNTDSAALDGLTGTVIVDTELTFYAIWEENAPDPGMGGGGGGSSPAPVLNPPTITSISAPEVCAVLGQLTIKGTYLSSATVKVDGLSARILSASSNEILVALPSAPVGTKTITVTNNDGSATTTVKYLFADTPIFVNYSYPETYKNRDFKYTFKADAAAKYEISGLMPAGLSLNSLTGEITGAPTQEGNFVFTIIASNICESAPLLVYMFVDKEIPSAFTCTVAFNNPRSDAISDIKLANLRSCLTPVPTLSPKYVSPVIFLSGGIPAGLTSDQALTHPRYLPIIGLIQSMNLNAQIYYGAFAGSTSEVQLNVYWPDPS